MTILSIVCARSPQGQAAILQEGRDRRGSLAWAAGTEHFSEEATGFGLAAASLDPRILPTGVVPVDLSNILLNRQMSQGLSVIHLCAPSPLRTCL